MRRCNSVRQNGCGPAAATPLRPPGVQGSRGPSCRPFEVPPSRLPLRRVAALHSAAMTAEPDQARFRMPPRVVAHALTCCFAAQFGGADPVLERAFRGHKGGVNALVFNPNMRQLVSGGEDGDVLVWHFKPSLRAYRFGGHKARQRTRTRTPRRQEAASDALRCVDHTHRPACTRWPSRHRTDSLRPPQRTRPCASGSLRRACPPPDGLCVWELQTAR